MNVNDSFRSEASWNTMIEAISLAHRNVIHKFAQIVNCKQLKLEGAITRFYKITKTDSRGIYVSR